MTIQEFNVKVECPHCEKEAWETAEFDTCSFDEHGGDSFLREVQCFDCDKKYWFKAHQTIEIEVEDVYKKKPKGPR